MPNIKTDRLTLITFTIDMMKAAISNKEHLEKITTYRVADQYPSEMYKEILPYKVQRFSQYPDENDWEGIIIHTKDHTIIGDMGIRSSTEDPKELELGYSIVPRYQGYGYATEMAKAMVKCGLEQPGIERIIAGCDNDNFASIRVLEKAGLKRFEEKENKIHWST
ncbi:Acetyltransferase (GNAT) domain-containing protein [Planococcus glaciei]|uniref:GNAT family N-acetyltransferase n=1 Tax=Planococcus glaciei TaxID=459472 RepID=UPI0008889238|nr:GNAT family N-acetyltransferase [Planococcus glaciei]SDI02510.1 Acetyltransferase (GNAT) domain-containing protein [Planococcus glaciei]